MKTIITNDCASCKWQHHPDGGHCYMFEKEPNGKCYQYRPNNPAPPAIVPTATIATPLHTEVHYSLITAAFAAAVAFIASIGRQERERRRNQSATPVARSGDSAARRRSTTRIAQN